MAKLNKRMVEGSKSSLLTMGQWPVSKDTEVFKYEIEGFVTRYFFLKSSQLRIELSDENGNLIRFTSQVIDFQIASKIILIINWKNNQIEVWINGAAIKSEDSNEIFSPKTQVIPETGNTFSWNDVNRDANCKLWMDWRTAKYYNPNPDAQQGRRVKSFVEQTNELQIALKDLEEFASKTGAGEYDHIKSIFPILRSLLFWPDKPNKNYNPLLIRIAGILNQPLPVYALPITGDYLHNLFSDTFFSIENNQPLPFTNNPKQVVMDLQDWLNSEVFKFNGAVYRPKDIIFETANTITYGHFDPDIPLQIDFLMNGKLMNVELLKKFAMEVTDITLYLGHYLLDNHVNKLGPDDGILPISDDQKEWMNDVNKCDACGHDVSPTDTECPDCGLRLR